MNIFTGLLVFLSFINVSEPIHYEEGTKAYYDKFPVYEGEEIPEGEVAGASILDDIINISDHKIFPEYKVLVYSLPLLEQDYYWGKFTNASAGGEEISRMKVLKAGDVVSVIGDGYVTLGRGRGYVDPGNGFYYGSGLCWSASTLGGMMDEANIKSREKYGIDIFVFKPGWRRGHAHWYQTYARSNNGYGYTIVKSGSGGQDYTFGVNSALEDIGELKGLRLQIKLSGISSDESAYLGQSMVAALYANREIF